MPIGPSGTSEHVPPHFVSYREGRALAESNAPLPANASPATRAGWLILQGDVASRIDEVRAVFAEMPADFKRSGIAAACGAALARRSHKPMTPSETALMGALLAISAPASRR